jgi:pimeloyl-ACP methyl ester carboxylesterase
MQRLHARRAALLLALAGILAGACSDHPDDGALIGPENTRPSAMVQPDHDINQADTYYQAEVYQEGSTTIESERPITDPVTGAVSNQFTAHHVRETQRIEGGYDHYGRIIQVLDQTDPIADPLATPVNLTRRTRSVEDQITRYDQYQQPVANELEPAQAMGSGPSHEQITDGLILDAAAIDTLAVLSPAAEPLAAAAGPRATVKRSQPDEIQITNELAAEEIGMSRPAASAGQVEQHGEVVRTYRRRGPKYFLEQVEVTTGHVSAAVRVRQRQVTRLRMLRFHENPQRDRERRGKRRIRPQPKFVTPLMTEVVCPMYVEGESSTCEPPPYEPPPPPTEDPCPPVASGVNVLFQHGIRSSGEAWWRMDRWVRCSFRTNAHIRPSIDWRVSIPSQREELLPYLPTPGNQTILIGHSNGGLVTRSLAQWAQTHRPGSVRGVVTLDSPNQGAIVAINVQVLEAAFFNVGMFVDLLAWHPFYEDDVPYSPFLIRTNQFDESFTRVGIQTHTPKRWVAWRIGWTPDHCPPESGCGERAVARRIQEAYDRHRHYSRFWYRPWQSAPAYRAMLVMNGTDALWNAFTAPGSIPSDGFIHGPGQVYPRAQRNRLIQNGDSHVGTTRSDYVEAELRVALRDLSLFAVPGRVPE